MHHNILEKLAFAQNGVALLTLVKPITKEPTLTRENATLVANIKANKHVLN